MNESKLCPVCEQGELKVCVGQNLVEYKGQEKVLAVNFCECVSCGSEISTSSQLRENKRLMVAFKKQVDGFLTGREIRKIRLDMGLTQSDAAKLFGGGPVAFSKYESDDVTQSESMDKLIRLAQAVPSALAFLVQQDGK